MTSLIIIKTVSILISLLASVFIYRIINKGIQNSFYDRNLKIEHKNILIWSILLWVLITFTLTEYGFFRYEQDDSFPKFLIGLSIPIAAILLLFISNLFRGILNKISLAELNLAQSWRIFGAVFFLVASSGLGPNEFTYSGYGDLVTGLLSILAFWAIKRKSKWSMSLVWTALIVGVSDLLLVLYILLAKYPIWSDSIPSTGFAGSFPMMLVISIAAPFALIIHIITLRKLIYQD